MTDSRRGPPHGEDDDVVVLARRGPLDASQQRELEAGVEADPTLRVAYDVGRAFDEVAFVRSGDEALIARAVDRALGVGNRRAVTRRWHVGAAVAAGFLLVATGVATAYWAGIGPRLSRPAAPGTHGVAPPARRAGAEARRFPAARAPASLAVAAPAEPGPNPRDDDRLDARPTVRVARPRPEPDEQPPAPTLAAAPGGAAEGNVTPDDLFRRAGEARRAGALTEAAELYRDLQARFPTVEEARLSHVSLGKLLLEIGQPQEAEQHFQAYLAGGAGALAAEAAVGRARSFERMGRPRDEREVWLGLLRDFPGSVYARAAQQRLAAIEANGVSPPDAPGQSPAGNPGTAR